MTTIEFLTTASPGLIMIIVGSLVDPAMAQLPQLTQKDLENPERVVQVAQEPVDEKNQAAAKRQYQYALKRMKQSYWDAAGKSFLESAIFYPTAKAFIGFAEARSHIAGRHDQATKFRMLEGIRNFLASAAAVDEIQKQLTPAETEQLQRDRACIEEFLATKNRQTDCRLVANAFGKDG